MLEVDYIVVGLGIAGLSFCEQLSYHDKSFIVYDHSMEGATLTSAGILNPTVLKRFTKVWNAEKHLADATQFYTRLSKELNLSFYSEIPIVRIINSVEEQNNWNVKSDKREMEPFLHPKIIQCDNPNINAPFGFGKVLGTGRVDTNLILQSYKEKLREDQNLIDETFDYSLLTENNNRVKYKNASANNIIFADGPNAVHNPFFQKDLLIANKGEYLIIHAPELKLNSILKASIFIVPIGEDLYKIGATYSHGDYTNNPTVEAREELIRKLSDIISCPYNIQDQIAGIRPTTKDRRPLLGKLETGSRISFFNGLGTRGIIAAPSLSKQLFDLLENGLDLPMEIDISRNLSSRSDISVQRT
jgi:glycine/D-amino acid oxidase-like deaminating enzyme